MASKKITLTELSENTEQVLSGCITLGDSIEVPVGNDKVIIIPEDEWVALTDMAKGLITGKLPERN